MSDLLVWVPNAEIIFWRSLRGSLFICQRCESYDGDRHLHESQRDGPIICAKGRLNKRHWWKKKGKKETKLKTEEIWEKKRSLFIPGYLVSQFAFFSKRRVSSVVVIVGMSVLWALVQWYRYVTDSWIAGNLLVAGSFWLLMLINFYRFLCVCSGKGTFFLAYIKRWITLVVYDLCYEAQSFYESAAGRRVSRCVEDSLTV